ncbi:transport and Golgi organization protein 1-like [Ornithodoros turicata]|uniref:transport and Golgi organization protein 1-like n=1 Tax=Ornithodoros turicata TaxID=34597 RepID=UPI003138AB9B
MALCRGSSLLSLLLLTKLLCVITAHLPETLLCADAYCTQTIGEGTTLQRFDAPDESRVSFLSRQKVTIYAKSNDRENDVYLVEINGRKGFAPRGMIREERSFHKRENLVTARWDGVFRSDNDNVSKYNEALQSSSMASSVTVQGTAADVLQQHTVQTSATPSLPEKSSIAPALVADQSSLLTGSLGVQPSLSNDASQSAATQAPLSSLSTERSCTLDGTLMYGEHCDAEASDASYHPPQSFMSGPPITTTPTPYGMNAERIVNAEKQPSISQSKVLAGEKPLSSIEMSQVNAAEEIVPHTNQSEGVKTEMEHSDKVSDGDRASLHVSNVSKMGAGMNERDPASEKMEDKVLLDRNKQEGDLPLNDTAGDAAELQMDQNVGERAASLDDNVSKGKEIENIPGEDDDDEDSVEVEEVLDETDGYDGEAEHATATFKSDSSSASQVPEHLRKATTNVAAAAQATVAEATAQKDTLSGSADDSTSVTLEEASPTLVEPPQPVHEESSAKVSQISIDNANLIASSSLAAAAGSLEAVPQQSEKSSLEPTRSETSQHVVGTSSLHELPGSSEGESSSTLLTSATEPLNLQPHLGTPLLNPIIDTLRSTDESAPSPSTVVGSVSTSNSEAETVAESPLLADTHNLSNTDQTAFDDPLKNEPPEESKGSSDIKATYVHRSLFSVSPSQDETSGTSVQSQTAASGSENYDTVISQHVVGTSSLHELSGSSKGESSSTLFASATQPLNLQPPLGTPLLNPIIDTLSSTESAPSPSTVVESVSTSNGEAAASSSEHYDAVISDSYGHPTQTEKQTDSLAVAPTASSDVAEGPPAAANAFEEESLQKAEAHSETKDALAVPEVPAALEDPLVAEISTAVNSPPVTDATTQSDRAPELDVPPETESSAHGRVPPISDGNTEQLKSDDVPSDESVGYVQLYLNLLKEYTQFVVDGLPEPLHGALHDQQVRGLSPRVTVFTFLCGFFSVVLVISFGCFLNDKKSTSLMVSIASLEKNLFNTRTERDVLKEEVEQFKLQVSSTHKMSLEKQDQLKRLLKENKDLERSNQQLEAALQKVRDAWNQDRNQLGTLSSELNQKENQIAELQCASEKEKEENQTLSSKLLQCEGIIEGERAKLEQLRNSEHQLQSKLEDMQLAQKELLQERNVLNERVDELSSKVEMDAEEIRKLLRSLHDRDAENQVLQESIKSLAVLQDMCNKTEDESQDAEASKEVETCLNRLMDVGQMRLEYQKIKEQNDVLEEQLAAERRHLEKKKDQVEALENEMEKLKRDTREAQRERTEAVTKLEILSAYFKDREVQLQKEIGKQEVLRNQKDADATTAEQQLSLLEQQNASYKSQLSSLKQEMEISERNYKNQITDQEKRAHENWLAARAAERKLEEANKELASMRQRLTLLQREKEQHVQAVLTNSHSTKALPSEDLQAGAPPLHPLPPPPPPMFLPPPPFMGEPFPPHPPEPWMLHGGLPPPPPPEVFKRHLRGSPGSFARASPGSSLRDDSPPPPPHSRGSPPIRLPHFYDSRVGHSPPPLGPSHGPPPMTLSFRGPRGLHRSSNSLSDGKSSAHSTSRPSPQPSPSVRKNNGPATGV